MFLLRCTGSLRAKLKGRRPAPTPGAASTTALGDWYAHVVRLGRREVILCIAEHSRLPVLLPVAEARRLETALPAALRPVLEALGVEAAAIDREVAGMREAVITKTASRSVLGTINDFAWMLEAAKPDDEGKPDIEHALWLADTPVGPMGGEAPNDRTRRIFAGQWTPEPTPAAGAAAPASAPTRVFRVKVTLEYSRPPIWRRIETPADVSLAQFHRILQIAMGWTDSHLHQFEQDDVLYGVSDREFGLYRVSEKRTRLSDVLRQPGDRIDYVYDFGDSWTHHIVLEAIEDAAAPVPPRVVKARRAAPPEDVGGIPGFAAFLEALENPRDPDHQEMLEWWGGPFDAEHVDVDRINRKLARMRLKLAPAPPPARRDTPFARMVRAVAEAGPIPPDETADDAFKRRLSKRTQDPTTILDDREVRYLAGQIGGVFHPHLPAASAVTSTLAEDYVRWSAVTAMCRRSRAERGLSIEDAAERLKAPLYRIAAAESGIDPAFDLAIAVRYFRLLGMELFIARWARAHPKFARRLGLG